MRATLLLPLAFVLTLSTASSADPSPATTIAKPTMVVACTAAAANDTTNLGDKKSASIAPPNVSYGPGATPTPIQYPCGKWVGDIEVASTAKAPAGFKYEFGIDVVLRPLDFASSKPLCEALKGNVEIYKKSGGGAFTLVGGGDVQGTWVAAAGATPAHCQSTEASGFKRVTGSVPASGTDTYRFVFPKTPAQLTGTIDRLAK
jgi:hypothetical protein